MRCLLRFNIVFFLLLRNEIVCVCVCSRELAVCIYLFFYFYFVTYSWKAYPHLFTIKRTVCVAYTPSVIIFNVLFCCCGCYYSCCCYCCSFVNIMHKWFLLFVHTSLILHYMMTHTVVITFKTIKFSVENDFSGIHIGVLRNIVKL